MKKKIALALALSLSTALVACSKEEVKETPKEEQKTETKAPAEKPAESLSAEETIKKNTQTLQDTLKTVKEALAASDKEKIKTQGNQLNEQWLTFETDIRSAYPLVYTEVEKYMLPLTAETSVEAMDIAKATDLAAKLETALVDLYNAKEVTFKASEQLVQAVDVYKKYIEEQTVELVKVTKEMTDAVRAGDMEKAKTAYVKARVFYERIEPVAESFGDLDPKIDAREGDVDEKDWTGFHVIEKALWKTKSVKDMKSFADKLDVDVKALQDSIAPLKLEPTQVVAGAMELLNEAAITKITGEEERYSRIDLVDLAANVEGSQAVYHAILPALTEKDKNLATSLDKGFTDMTKTLAKYRKGDSYIPYTEVTKNQVREISQQLTVLSEEMGKTAQVLQQ